MTRRRRIYLLAAAVGLVSIVALLRGSPPSQHSAASHITTAGSRPAPPLSDAASEAPPAPPARPQPRRPDLRDNAHVSDAQVIASLQEKFAKTIHHKHTQIKFLEQLMSLLSQMYPDDWQARLLDFLRQIFPERADALYAQFQKLMRYNDWMRDNRHELVQMDARDRREALWDTRRQFFGEDADEIWEVTRRNEQILDSVDSVEESGGSLDEKLDSYLEAINRAYGEQAPQFVQKRQTELMLRFLSIDSVQDDLHALAPEERRQALREVRRGLGLDDAALARLEALDGERDREWSIGETYMQQRADIVTRSHGEAQQRQLDQLRAQTFGAEAEAIRDEEAAGFFRFQQRRRLGRD